MDQPPVPADSSTFVLTECDDSAAVPSDSAVGDKVQRAQDDDAAALAAVVTAYQQILARATHAQQFLTSVGLGDPALAKKFILGFSNKSLVGTLPSQDRATRERLTRLGVLRTTGHAQHLGCIVTPVFADGVVVDVIGMRQHALTRGQQGMAIEPRLTMPRPRTPAHRRRMPLGISVSPASITLLDQITKGLDLPWSRGAIVDRALQLAEADLLREAAGRQVVILLGPLPRPHHSQSSP